MIKQLLSASLLAPNQEASDTTLNRRLSLPKLLLPLLTMLLFMLASIQGFAQCYLENVRPIIAYDSTSVGTVKPIIGCNDLSLLLNAPDPTQPGGSADLSTATTYTWTVISAPPGGSTDAVAQFDNPTILNPIFTPNSNVLGNYTLRLTIRASCNSGSTGGMIGGIIYSPDVIVRVENKPTITLNNPSSNSICTGASGFGVAYSGLTGNPVSYSIAITDLDGTGATIGGAGLGTLTNVVLPNSGPITIPFINPPTAAGTIAFTITVTDVNGCTSLPIASSVKVFKAPVATAGADRAICSGTSSGSLGGNAPLFGENGAWSIVSTSPGGITGTWTPNTSSPTATFTPTSAGDYTLRWTVFPELGSPCAAATEDVLITSTPITTCSITTPPQNAAVGSSVTLTAANPAPHSGTWAVSSGLGTITNATSYTNGILNVTGAGAITVTWTVAGINGCTNSVCNVTITGVAPSIADADPANDPALKAVCLAGSPLSATATLSATALPPNMGGNTTTGLWSLVSEPSGATTSFANPTTTGATFTANMAGSYILRWTTTSEPGTVVHSDDVEVRFWAPTSINTPTQYAATGSTVALSAIDPAPLTGTWSLLPAVPVGAAVANITSAANGILTVGAGVNNVQFAIDGAPAACTSTKDNVIITGIAAPADLPLQPDVCLALGVATGTTGALGGSFPILPLPVITGAITTGAWSLVTGPSGATWSFSAPASGASTFSADLPGVYTLRWTTTTNPGNVVFSKDVQVRFWPATSINTAVQYAAVGSTVLLDAIDPAPLTGTWSVLSGPGTVSNAASATNGILTVTGTGPITVQWALDGGAVCPTTRATVIITGIVAPAAIAPVADVCINGVTGTTLNITATLPLPLPTPLPAGTTSTGAWNVVTQPSGSTWSFSNPTGLATTFTADKAGTYTLSWTTITNPGNVVFVNTVNARFWAQPTANVSGTGNDHICAGGDGDVTVNFQGVPQFSGVMNVQELDIATNAPIGTLQTTNFVGINTTDDANVTIPAALLANPSGPAVRKYQITVGSVDDAGLCTGIVGNNFVYIYVEPLPDLATGAVVVVPQATGNTDVCPGSDVIFAVTNPNQVGGTFNYTVTSSVALPGFPVLIGGASYNNAFNFGNFGLACPTATELTFTFTPIGPGTNNCPGLPVTKTVWVRDTVRPVITTLVGSLNRSVSCDDAAGLTAAQALTITATDMCSTPVITETTSTVLGTCPGNYVITNILTATDNCGNFSTFTQTITVYDNVSPVFDATQLTSAQSMAIDCSTPLAQALLALVPNTFSPYMSNASGVLPNITVTFPASLLLSNTVGGVTIATGTDNCSGVSGIDSLRIIMTQPNPSSCPQNRTYTISYKLVDACGNNDGAWYSQVIAVSDVTGPVITLAGGVPLNNPVNSTNVIAHPTLAGVYLARLNVGAGANCTVPMPDYRAAFTYTDACTMVTSTIQGDNGTPGYIGPNKEGTPVIGYGVLRDVSIRAVDQCGNSTIIRVWVTLIDSTVPNAICKSSLVPSQTITLILDANGKARVNAKDPDAGSNDNCTPTSLLRYKVRKDTDAATDRFDYVEFGCADAQTLAMPTASRKVWMYVMDAAGNESACEQLVIIKDEMKPVITNCGSDVTLYWDLGCTQIMPDLRYNNGFAYTDNCTATLTQVPAPGSIIGQNYPWLSTDNPSVPVEITVTDASNNSVKCVVNVYFKDNTAPVISGCPQNQSLVRKLDYTQGACRQSTTWTRALATDNCYNPLSTVNTLGGIKIKQWIEEGPAGSKFTDADDYNAATMVSAGGYTVSADGKVVEWTVNGTNFANAGTQSGVFALGTTKIGYQATDAAGNTSAICWFYITVSEPRIFLTNNVVNPTTCNDPLNNTGGIIVTPNGGTGGLAFEYTGTIIVPEGAGIRADGSKGGNTITQFYDNESHPHGLTGQPWGNLYQYSLDGAAYTTIPASTQSYGNLAQGNHYILVRDLCGQVARLDFTIAGMNSLAATTAVVNNTCSTGTTGSITVNATGGNSPYVYEISNSAGVFPNPAQYQTSNVFSNLAPGTYKVNVRDASNTGTAGSGCLIQSTVTVASPAAVGGTIAGTATVAQNSTATNVTFSATGGTAPYTFVYTVNGGAEATVTGAATASVSQSTSALGTYTYTLVSVTDANGCVFTAAAGTTAVITVGAAGNTDLTPIIEISPTIITGATGNFAAAVTVANVGSSASVGTIRVFVNKVNRIVPSFPGTATAVGPFAVSNSVWTLDATSNGSFYIFSTNSVIPVGGVLAFGWNGTLSTTNSNGTLSLTSTLPSGTGGDTNTANNGDSEGMSFFYQ